MSHFKAKMHQILFPASVRPSVLLLDGVWQITQLSFAGKDDDNDDITSVGSRTATKLASCSVREGGWVLSMMVVYCRTRWRSCMSSGTSWLPDRKHRTNTWPPVTPNATVARCIVIKSSLNSWNVCVNRSIHHLQILHQAFAGWKKVMQKSSLKYPA